MLVTAAEVAKRLRARPAGEGRWSARCPGHEDRNASLSISASGEGTTLIHCHAGCDTRAVVAAAGLAMADLFEGRPRTTGHLNVVATYTYPDEAGAELFQVVRLEPKSFRQRHKARSGEKADREGWCWNMAGVRRVLYRLPDVLAAAKAGLPIWLVEGEKDADGLVALGLVATCNAGGAGKWRTDYTASLQGVARVVVVADKDEPGRKHAVQVARSLAKAGIPTRVVEVTEGKDASDWIASGATREDFEALPEATEQLKVDGGELAPSSGDWEVPRTASKPEIKIGPDEARVIAESIASLVPDPDLYQRGRNLVRVTNEGATSKSNEKKIQRDPKAPKIEILPTPWVRTRMADMATWMSYREGEGWKRAHPPKWAVDAVATAGHWDGIRPLEGVIETPTLRPQGTILATPGYDDATGLLFQPIGPVDAVPENPTTVDVQRAVDEILELVADFPFASDAHRSAWFCALLTPFLRHAFAGPVPMMLFDANVRAAGKTLLTSVIGVLVLGRQIPVTTLPKDEDERRKRITAFVLAGDGVVLIDNVEGILGGAVLNAALTATQWDDRILGVSKTTGSLPLLIMFLVTGNNSQLGADTSRRTIHCRLSSTEEKPEERSDFRQADLLAHVRQHRPRLVAACLTICRGYFAAVERGEQRPESMKLTAMGSFEGWTLVRRVLVHAGLPDPLQTQVTLSQTADTELRKLRGLIEGLAEVAGEEKLKLSAAQILAKCDPSEAGKGGGQKSATGAALREVLVEHYSGKDAKLPDARSLGYALRHFVDRIVDGKAIRTEAGGRVAKWWVDCGSCGRSGSSPATPHARARAQDVESGCQLPQSPQLPQREPGEDEDDLPLDLAGGAPCGQ